MQFTRSPFQRQQDQEEEDEVITFDNPSSSLPRGGAMRRHTLSEDYNDGGKNKTSAELISPKTK